MVCEYFPGSSGREMRGGVEARTYFVGRRLARSHDVTVYAVRESGLEEEGEFEGMRVVRVEPEVEFSQSSSLARRLMFMRNAARLLRAGGFDLVDGCSFLGYPAAWRSGCAARVATYHDVWLGEWARNIGWKGIFGEAIERYTLSRRWSRLIAVSEYTKNKLMAHGIKGDMVTVARNGIDVEEYTGVRAVKCDKPTVSCVARLVKYKRVSDLLEAAAALKPDIPDLQLKVIGTGPERGSLESKATSLGISDSVEFMGYVEKHADVLRTVKASHALCLPSVVEGFGITVVEAMALGVPYVAADIPAVREATRGGAGGLLYKPCDVGELARKLREVLDGGVRGGAGFIGEYDWSRTAEKVEGVYESVVG